MTPLELFRRLWVRKYWELLILIVSVSASLAYLKFAVPQYDIQAHLLLHPDAQLLSIDKNQGARKDTELTATQSEVLASQSLITRAIKTYLIDSQDPLAAKELQLIFAEELTVKPVVGTRILSANLRWNHADRGIKLLQCLIDEYQDFLVELDQDGQNDALQTLAQTEAKIRAELVQLQTDYRESFHASGLFGSDDAGWALQQSLLQELGKAFVDIRSRRLVLENRIATLDAKLTEPDTLQASGREPADTNETTLVSAAIHRIEPVTDDSDERGWGALQMLNNVNLQGLQDPVAIQHELFQAKSKRQELVQTYRSKHPAVRAIDKQIVDWEERLQSIIDRAPVALEREHHAVKLQESRLQLVYESELSKAKQLDRIRLEQQHKQKEIEKVEALHSTVITQLAALRLNQDAAKEGGADLRITVLKSPTPGKKPAWPNTKLVLGGGLLSGLLLISLLVLLPIPDRSPVEGHGKIPN